MAIPQNKESMLASETRALSEGIDNAFGISMLLGKLLNNDYQKTIPIKCFVDNRFGRSDQIN